MDRKKTSKFISLILRHKPEAIGITLDEHGWASVDMLLKGLSAKYPITFEQLEEIVALDEKGRYSFNDDKTLIRANQGHSIAVDVELKECAPPQILYHGTGEKFCQSIDVEGVLPKTRLYVHLSADKNTALAVGKRHGKPAIYTVFSGEMYENGYKFYISENGVWLTRFVPPEYISKEASNG